MSAVDTVRYHARFLRKGYSLPDENHFLPDFKLRVLKLASACSVKGLQSVRREARSDILAAEEDGTAKRATIGQSTSQDRGDPAASACLSGQSTSKTTAGRAARETRKK